MTACMRSPLKEKRKSFVDAIVILIVVKVFWPADKNGLKVYERACSSQGMASRSHHSAGTPANRGAGRTPTRTRLHWTTRPRTLRSIDLDP